MTLRFEPQTVAAIAELCLGKANKSLSSARELRFGNHGALSVDLGKGIWHDHSESRGGGMLDLIERSKGLTRRDAVAWLRQHGLDIGGDDSPVSANGNSAQGAPNATFETVATYKYTDERGALLFEVLRQESDEIAADGKPHKKFLQRAPDGSGGWTWSTKGVRQIPYRLPELLEDVVNGSIILLVEGEKCVDALRAIGVSATCNARGAGKWPDELTPFFMGADIVVLPDNDEPGRKHGELICSKLLGVAHRVRLLNLPGLPPKGDVADWLARGGTAEALLDLIENAAKPWAPGQAHGDGEGSVSFVSSCNERIEENSWPKPQPLGNSLPAVAPFVPDLLPDALRDYVFDVADRQQAPPDFAAVAALCGLASLAGNNVRICPKQHDDWTVVPNLWGAIIGRPSAMKSPAMRSALAPVYALQDAARKEWETAHRAANIDAALSNLDAREAARKAAKAIKGGDRDEAKRLLSEHSCKDSDDLPCPRLIVNDSTVEKLGELLNENPRGLLLIRDELPGFLARMEREESQSERAFYLEAFNGDGTFTYDRIGRGTVHIENSTLSMIGGMQPARIFPLVRGAATGVTDDGLIQRLQLTVWPDDIGSWTWKDRSPNAGAKERYEAAFRDVHDFARKFETPALFFFSNQAQEMFKEWMIEIQTQARGGNLSSVLESHLLKMPKTVASLALLFHLVDGGRDAVGAEATARALDWADYLRSHANRLYSAGCAMAENGARLIIERRAQLPDAFTARDLQRKAWAGLTDRDIVAAAIELLVDAGYCRGAPSSPSPAGGRPSLTYVWNPHIKAEG